MRNHHVVARSKHAIIFTERHTRFLFGHHREFSRFTNHHRLHCGGSTRCWLVHLRFFAIGPTLGFKTDDKPAPQPTVTPNSTPKRPPPTVETPPTNTAGSLQKYAGQEQLTLLRLQRAEFEFRTANLKTVISNVKQRSQKHRETSETSSIFIVLDVANW